MKVVLDTNILISARQFDGNEREVLSKAIFGKYKLVICEEILEEVERILKIKFGIQNEDISLFLQELKQLSEFPKERNEYHIMNKIHKNDNIITDCAINGNADFIVSGDRHLLELKEIKHKGKLIKIIKAKEFLRELEK